MTPVPLEELEIHLLDEIERQRKSGQGEAEAFATAVQKIGLAPAVQNEFAKAEAIAAAGQWPTWQILFWVILGAGQLILIGAILLNSEVTVEQ